MDADFFRRVDFGPISGCLDSLDPEIGLVLEQLTEKDREDVEDELFEVFELKALLESRTTVFRIAMDKVDLCLSQVAMARDLESFVPSENEANLIDKANKLFRKLSPKDMINRKCSKRAIKDILDLLAFIGDDNVAFPVMIMRTKTNGCARKPIGGVSVDDMVCLQHLSELMIPSGVCSMDNVTERVEPTKVKVVWSPVAENRQDKVEEKCGSGTGSSMFVDMKDTQFLADERMPSRMNGCANDCDSEKTRKWKVNDVGDDDENETNSVYGSDISSICSNIADNMQGEIVVSDDEIDKQVIAELFQTSTDTGHMNGPKQPVDGRESPVINVRHTNRLVRGKTCISHPNAPVESSDLYCKNANESTCEPRHTDLSNAIDQTNGHTPYTTREFASEYNPEHCKNANESTCEPRHTELSNAIDQTNGHTPYTTREFASEYNPERPSTPQIETERTLPCKTDIVPEPTSELVTPANVVISVGGRSVRIDISSLFEMASKYPIDPPADLAALQGRHGRCCSVCDRKSDEHTRMVSESEDRLNEQMRKLRLDNEVMADELERVKRKLREVSNQRQLLAPPDRTEGEAPPRDRPSDHRSAEVSVRRKKTELKKQEQLEPRRRAATFNGPGMYNNRQPTRDSDGQLARGVQNARPQRPTIDNARERPNKQGGGDRDTAQKDNPLKSWLTKKGINTETTPNEPKKGDFAIRSPSWADDDTSCDEVSFSSCATAPSPPMDQHAGTAGPSHTLRPLASADNVDDVYLLPPSGQVTRRTLQQNNGIGGESSTRTDHRGARPKTRGKGVSNVDKNSSKSNATTRTSVNKTANRRDGNSRSETYAKVVTRNGWNTVQKKRKFDKVSPRASFPLLGIPATVNREVYLQGLRVSEGMCADDVNDSVKAYCLERGITPIYMRAIPVKYDCTRTGCKLTICEEDYERVILDEFWPEDVSVRDWTPRVRDNQNNGDGARPPSDEDYQ